MPISKINFRPGVVREGTSYSNEGGWFDVNKVRFNAGLPQKIGGWVKDNTNTFLGTCRALLAWVDLAGTKYLGLGTHLKYYVELGTGYHDITPIRSTTSAGDVTFSATNGSSSITVADTAHGAVKNDFVTFSGASSLGGNITANVLNQEYQIASITNANSYVITAKDTSGTTVTANSSDSGNGGSSVVGAYQINVGLDVFISSTGWGSGAWGAGAYGESTVLSISNQLRLWTHDHFGEDLLINVRAGGLYYWDESGGVNNRAVELSSLSGSILAPTVGLQVLVSETDRHVIVLGSDPISGSSRTGVVDPMLVAFSDQENLLDFEPLLSNTAGDLRLSEGSTIIGAVKARQEILIWTDTALYSMQFIGPPFTFGLNLINNASGLISPNGAVVAPSGVFWMGYDNFYIYNGSVQKVPCSVLSYVFDDMNSTQTHKFFAFTNTEFDEVGWFYCSSDSSEIDRYVVFDYADKVWTYGQISRTAWLDTGVKNYPRAVSNNYLYRHEFGYNDDGSPMTDVFIESSDFDIGDGDTFSFIRKIIPDVRFLNNSTDGQVNIVLKTRNFPGESLNTSSTNAVGSSTTQSHVRARGRQAVVRLESDDDDTDANNDVGWRLGLLRMDIQNDGRR
tara:strand:- start:362 stop:2227 length:1866 start_codon:yes stop_codon:yes gene_type:complete